MSMQQRGQDVAAFLSQHPGHGFAPATISQNTTCPMKFVGRAAATVTEPVISALKVGRKVYYGISF